MALLKKVSEYRSNIMRMLCSDKDIVRLVSDKKSSTIPDKSLIYKNIYPYAYVPNTNTGAETFICFCFNFGNIYDKTYKKGYLTFYVFSNQKILRTSDGLRCDLIAERIEELFNGNYDIGLGRMQLSSVDDISPINDYHGVSIQYTFSDFNRPTIGRDWHK